MSTSTPIMPMWAPEPALMPEEVVSAASENDKKYYIWTIGCQMNVAESNQMAAAFQHAGLGAAATEAEADIIVLNSCVVRQASEDKVKGKIGSLYALKRISRN